MSVRTVVVAHREMLAAEGIGAALSRFPALMPVGVASDVAEAERLARQADAIAIDARLPGAEGAAGRLRKRGIRVVMIGGGPADDVDGSVVVAVDASMSQLASALAPGARQRASRLPGLTQREGQVLHLASKGMAGKQIARSLGISPKTVEQHKTRAFRRLGVPNQVAAVALLTQEERASWSPSSI